MKNNKLYYLNETELSQLNAWSVLLEQWYTPSDTLLLQDIINRSIYQKYIDIDDIYKLLELLPKIIPENCIEQNNKLEDSCEDWQSYMDEQRIRYKREVDKLCQVFLNWVFLQSSVYQKNTKSIRSLFMKEKNKNKKCNENSY